MCIRRYHTTMLNCKFFIFYFVFVDFWCERQNAIYAQIGLVKSVFSLFLFFFFSKWIYRILAGVLWIMSELKFHHTEDRRLDFCFVFIFHFMAVVNYIYLFVFIGFIRRSMKCHTLINRLAVACTLVAFKSHRWRWCTTTYTSTLDFFFLASPRQHP